MSKPISRVKDRSHPSKQPAATGSANVLLDGRPVLRVGDVGVGGWRAVAGAPCVLVNGRPLHRMTDRHSLCSSFEGSTHGVCGDVDTPSSLAGAPPPPTDVELIFVPYSLDEALVEHVLIVPKEDLAAFEADEQRWQMLHEQLAKALASHDEVAIAAAKDSVQRELSSLVSGEATSKLTEVRRLFGNKFTYVRSDKIKNEWRKYKLESHDRDSSLRTREGKLDKKKLKKAFEDLSMSIKGEKQFIDRKGSLIWFVPNAERYIEEVNQSLSWSLKKGVPPQDVMYDVKADAQLLRWFAKGSGKWAWDPANGEIGLTGEVSASAALARGTFMATGYLPNAAGGELVIPLGAMTFDLGRFRGRLELEAAGFLGASAFGSVALEFDARGDVLGFRGARKKGQSGAPNVATPASKKLGKSPKETAPVKASGDIFAGARIGGTVTGALEWDDPEKRTEEAGVVTPGWSTVFSVGYGVKAAAGIGINGEFVIGLKGGKFVFRAKAGAVLGVGAGGEISGEVDAGTIWGFLKFIYRTLANNQFGKLAFVEPEAFYALSILLPQFIMLGPTGLVAVHGTLHLVKASWKALWTDWSRARELADGVLAGPDALRYTTPEGKGAMLYVIAYAWDLPLEEKREVAVLAILECVQSWTEYKYVCARMGPDPSVAVDWKVGHARLEQLLDGAEQRRFEVLKNSWTARLSSSSIF